MRDVCLKVNTFKIIIAARRDHKGYERLHFLSHDLPLKNRRAIVVPSESRSRDGLFLTNTIRCRTEDGKKLL